MARKRATMREGPLAELFRKTEAAQRSQGEAEPAALPSEEDARAQAALDETVEHVPDFAKDSRTEPAAEAAPVPEEVETEEVPTEAAASRAAARYFQTMLEPAPRLHRVPPPKGSAYIAAIRVVGVGGAGLNAIHRMIDAGIAQVDFIAVNTDRQALAISDAPTKISFGEGLTQEVINEAGDFIYIKPGVPHEVFNVGDGPLVALVARSTADEWDKIIPYDKRARAR